LQQDVVEEEYEAYEYSSTHVFRRVIFGTVQVNGVPVDNTLTIGDVSGPDYPTNITIEYNVLVDEVFTFVCRECERSSRSLQEGCVVCDECRNERHNVRHARERDLTTSDDDCEFPTCPHHTNSGGGRCR
jgi:hypothetical protein